MIYKYLSTHIAFYAYQSDLAVPYHFGHIVAFYVAKHNAHRSQQ